MLLQAGQSVVRLLEKGLNVLAQRLDSGAHLWAQKNCDIGSVKQRCGAFASI
ncbi:MAG: hypothetical protein ACLPKB_17760 [Xanthobacteraceae bacterium]